MLQSGQRPNPAEIEAVVLQLRTAAGDRRSVGTVEEIEPLRGLALLLLEVATHTDPPAAAETYAVAFDEGYVAASRAISLAWGGDHQAQQLLPYTLRTLAHVCVQGASHLTDERLGAGVGAFERVVGLDAVANDVVYGSAMLMAHSVASKAVSGAQSALSAPPTPSQDRPGMGSEPSGAGGRTELDQRSDELLIGPLRGPDAPAVASRAERYSGWAVKLFQLACDGMTSHSDQSAIAELAPLVASCHVAVLQALTFSSAEAAISFKAVVSVCNWADEISPKLVNIAMPPDGSPGAAIGGVGLGQRLVDLSADIAYMVMESSFGEIDIDRHTWLVQARQLSQRYWPDDDVALPSEVVGSTRSSTRRLSSGLNLIEYRQVASAFHLSMGQIYEAAASGARERPPGAPAARRDTRDRAEPAADAEVRAGNGLNAIPPETFWDWVTASVLSLLEHRDPMIVKAVATVLSEGTGDTGFEPIVEDILANVRARLANDMEPPVWAAVVLAEQVIVNPNRYLLQVENMIVDTLLPALETKGDPSWVLEQALSLIHKCTADIRFKRHELAQRLVLLARRLAAHPASADDVSVQYILARALWMLGHSDEAVMGELQTVTQTYLTSVGSQPNPENLQYARAVIETIRFAIESNATFRALQRQPESPVDSPERDRREGPLGLNEMAGLLDNLRTWERDLRVDEENRQVAAALRAEVLVFCRDYLATDTNDDDADADLAALARQRPHMFLATLLGKDAITAGEQDLAIAVIRADVNSGVPSRFSLGLWAALLSSQGSSTLNLSGSTRLALARRLVGEVEEWSPTVATNGLALVSNLSDLLDDHALGFHIEALAEDAGHLVQVAAIDGPTPVVHDYLANRAARGLQLAVTRHEHLERLMVAMAAYAMAVWLQAADAAARDAYLVGEYFRLGGQRMEAEWWYGLYDYWRAEGALEGPEHELMRRLIEEDRNSPLGRRA
jgi:hypothetical protein